MIARTISRFPRNKDSFIQIKKQASTNNPKTDEILHFYLDKKQEELNSPQFIRKRTQIHCSNEFLNEEFKNYLYSYYDNYNGDNQDAYEDKNIDIEWITISNANADIDYIFTTCKIQLTAKSVLNAKYSIFIPKEISKTESAVEVFANSQATFTNCVFKNSIRTAVIGRDFSTVTFDHCVFENNNISCFLMNGSKAKFINCKFSHDKNISIFVTKDSHCEIIDCEFFNLEGKAIFAKDSSDLLIKDTQFKNCKKGAVTIAEKTKLMIDGGVTIENSQNTAIRSIKNSEIKAHDVKITKTDGNAINLEDSTGYFVNFEIRETVHPTIAVLGQKSNPIFTNCNLYDNKDTFCVICKNGSRPLFDSCSFYDCATNCFSVTDFSRPHVQDCYFKNIEKYYMNIFGGSYLTFYNIKTDDDNIEEKINIRKSGKCEYKSLTDIDEQVDDNNKPNENEKGKPRCTSWVSPTYIVPSKLEEIEEPKIIKERELKHLKLIDTNEVIDESEKQETSFKCSHCHKEMTEDDEPNIISPCGHLVCKNCKDLKKCPLCDTPVKKVQKIFFEEVCALCLDHKPNTVSLPCGHMCMCYNCAMQNAENNYNCPMCNEPLTAYKFLFDDISADHFHFECKNDVEINENEKINETDFENETDKTDKNTNEIDKIIGRSTFVARYASCPVLCY